MNSPLPIARRQAPQVAAALYVASLGMASHAQEKAEDEIVDKAYTKQVQPLRIETDAKTNPKTRFVQGPAYRPFAVRDRLLISGQQGSAGARTAELVIQALEG